MAENDPLPIATATIARLCMIQGKLEQAKLLYGQLLRENPRDRRILAGLADVERREKAREAPSPSANKLEIYVQDGATWCRWQVTEEGLRRARLVLGQAGDLILRLIPFPLSPARPPSDTPLPELSGKLALSPPSQTALLAGAVGLLAAEGRFVSIVHCTAQLKGSI